MAEKIFLLEDDAYLRDGLLEMLQGRDYEVESAESIKKAEIIIKEKRFSLLIFDVMLSDGSSFDLCERLRAHGIRATLKVREANNIPIIILSAKSEDADKILGLNVGADDYVTKPFKLLELLSRIRALIRRNAFQNFVSSDLVIDTNNMTVKKDNQNIFVTKTEFQILSMLIRNNGAIVTRSSLLQSIWDDSGNFIDDNTLSVHVSRLREKIGADKIATVRGIGYRWEENI